MKTKVKRDMVEKVLRDLVMNWEKTGEERKGLAPAKPNGT